MPSPIRRAALLPVILATACASTPQNPLIMLRVADGPLWLTTDEVGRYVCQTGLLVCQDAVGRTSERLCRCVQ
jgi:hypothetical protein